MADEEELEKIDPVPEMAHWTLALVNSPGSIEEMRRGPIRGFVYVAEVDTERKRLKILSPVSGRLGDQPLVWGRWPEPYINLLG
jgi:polyribonucleotide 5'-hydroxyl-kinase